jgi:ABC-type multidrug transport system fused ATPase/permease subunit
LESARRRFAQATLLCITHDLDETRGFSRVLVLEGGAVVEDGRPEALLARPGSRYAALQAAETQAQRRLSDPTWRRLRVRDGQARMEDGE